MDVLTRLRRVAAAAAVFSLCVPGLAAQDTIERDVKAAFLYNFTRFIEWPGGAPQGEGPFRLCVVADGAMERAIRRTVAGESVQGRPLVMAEPRTPQDAQDCQILYVGRSESDRASRLLAAVRDRPVLTVGDSSRFVEQGGAIQFVLEDNRVRFDVNLPSARRSNLKVSSNLLRVARKIEADR